MRLSDKYEAAVTVFLTFIFLFVCSVIFILLEVASQHIAKARLKQELFMACESELGEYNGPLMAEYDIYAIDMGFGKSVKNVELLTSRVEDYLPADSFGLSDRKIVINETYPLTEDREMGFVNQMIRSAEEEAIRLLAEKLGNAVGLLEEQSEQIKLYERVSETEGKFRVMDEYTLELMRLIDGIDLTPIATGNSGYSIGRTFVKKLQTKPVSSLSTGINNALLFAELSSQYVNPITYIDRMGKYADRYHELDWQLYMLEEDIFAMEEEQESEDFVSDEDYESTLKEFYELYEITAEGIYKTEADFNATKNYLIELYSEQETAVLKSIEITEKAMKAQKELSVEVEELEQYMCEAGLGKGSTDGTLDVLKQYAGLIPAESVTDFIKLNGILEHIAADINKIIREIESASVMNYGRVHLTELTQSVSYDGICFDYSSVITEKSLEESAIASLSGYISKKFLNYIVEEPTNISSLQLSADYLPGRALGMSEIEDGVSFSDEPSLAGIEQLINIRAIRDEDFPTRLAVILYANQHFKSFVDSHSRGDTSLEYELEYLAKGSLADEVNLAGVSFEIFLLRLMPDVVYVYSDSKIKAEATALATSVVGFTGVPIIVSAVRHLILFTLAAEQAVVETSALLQGKKLPLLIDSGTFCMNISDLLQFTPGLVRLKAGAVRSNEHGISYEQYLFLKILRNSFNENVFRTMDLIQENIRYKYNEDFRFLNCISGFSAKGVCDCYFRYWGAGWTNKEIKGYRITDTYNACY